MFYVALITAKKSHVLSCHDTPFSAANGFIAAKKEHTGMAIIIRNGADGFRYSQHEILDQFTGRLLSSWSAGW